MVRRENIKDHVHVSKKELNLISDTNSYFPWRLLAMSLVRAARRFRERDNNCQELQLIGILYSFQDKSTESLRCLAGKISYTG